MREEQRAELERKRLDRQARAKGLGIERAGSSRHSSRPGSSSGLGSAAGSAQSSPRKVGGGGNYEGLNRMESVRREVDVGETW